MVPHVAMSVRQVELQKTDSTMLEDLTTDKSRYVWGYIWNLVNLDVRGKRVGRRGVQFDIATLTADGCCARMVEPTCKNRRNGEVTDATIQIKDVTVVA